jgi:hypothetical protein
VQDKNVNRNKLRIDSKKIQKRQKKIKKYKTNHLENTRVTDAFEK